MFQDTRQRSDPNQDQDQQKKEQDLKARTVTDDVRHRMLRDAETRTYESQAQAISGRLQEALVRERPGASAEEVAQKAAQQAMPELERGLAQLEVPLAEDTRWMVRDNVRRAIMERAMAIETEKAEEIKSKDETQRE